MRTENFQSKTLKALLNKQKIATLDQLKVALGTTASMTVFRKLDELSYRSSYSHRGKYYTMSAVVQFNQKGLWSYKNIHFSVYGTLLETVKAFVVSAEKGYLASELKSILQIEVKEPLLALFKENQITREMISGLYIYFSSNDSKKQKQFQQRIKHEKHQQASIGNVGPEILSHELKAAIILFFSILDEQQRRLYAGLESLKLGRGGDSKIADLFGMDPHTIAIGRKELLNQDINIERIRQTGGGRHSVEKKHQKL